MGPCSAWSPYLQHAHPHTQECDLATKVTKDGYVYIQVRKGIYRLPLVGKLAQELLKERLNKKGYCQSKLTPGLCMHDWQPINFPLCIDDFGIKYADEEHAKHLVATLKDN